VITSFLYFASRRGSSSKYRCVIVAHTLLIIESASLFERGAFWVCIYFYLSLMSVGEHHRGTLRTRRLDLFRIVIRSILHSWHAQKAK